VPNPTCVERACSEIRYVLFKYKSTRRMVNIEDNRATNLSGGCSGAPGSDAYRLCVIQSAAASVEVGASLYKIRSCGCVLYHHQAAGCPSAEATVRKVLTECLAKREPLQH